MAEHPPRRRYADRHWTVDRHIPLALIMAILFQTAVGVWWAATMQARVNALEKLLRNGRAQDSYLGRGRLLTTREHAARG